MMTSEPDRLLARCLDTTEWVLVAMSQLASSAVGRIVSGGAATAAAVQYRLINDSGFAASAAVTGLTVATLSNFAVLLAQPIFAVPVFVTASLLSRVPFTPGSLGFVEAGDPVRSAVSPRARARSRP